MIERINNHLIKFYPSSSLLESKDKIPRSLNKNSSIGAGNKYLFYKYNGTISGIKREENFTNRDQTFLENLINELDKLNISTINDYYYDILIEKAFDMSIVKYIFKENELHFLKLFEKIYFWRNKTYEGSSVNLGIEIELEEKDKGEKVNILEIFEEDYIAPIGDGVNTFIKTDKNGIISGMGVYEKEDKNAFIPIRFSNISKKPKSQFIILTRLGDIMIVENSQLKFAKKGNYWVEYNHQKLTSRLTAFSNIEENSLKNSIYLSCIDVSFAKTGGLISIIGDDSNFTLTQIVDSDSLNEPKYIEKIRFFNELTKQKSFQSLERQIRKEILAIDGGLILSSSGKIISIGTIVKLPGGSSGGGRTAAAKELSKLGIAIKISNDGYIQLFRKGISNEVLRII
ncbi:MULTISPECIES: hypothetical protein [Leptospira]|uniref:Uncharacterized protein n=1 Tax=Leptospira soteropolitanensis TaxID=2950025 RepID=A0AAW5VHU4_9LEPT|nr:MULTISPECIES: hypothetical protein [Leptospira]MCW7471762.1 hypothetical protein [Leptospira kanakyensis]MCW7494713.1 hypothetical protein [Leptospira soteropolitanensis]MCW7502320.1 hypothetical protein [Leptospira soteropolitanensis]MCW7524542.1 hypothetical protein [Leptospira soteropolitanensis]MCW7528417.1 hypothetical protein [Leptospira soteropolitanensis]